MGVLLAIIGGVVCGFVATAPLLVELRRDEPDIGRGFGSVIMAFVVIQVLMLVLFVWQRSLVAPFGVPAVLTFLLVAVVVAVMRGQHGGE